MTNDFGQRVYPVIRYVLNVLKQVRAAEQDAPGANEVASRLKTLLSQFDVEGARSNEFDLAKRALVYWIDEVLINSEWEDANWWSDNTLERHFYDSRERAWRFFEKAAVARQLQDLDALETFYLCACLGFWGTYRDRKSTASSGDKPTSDTWPEMPIVKADNEPESEAELKDEPKKPTSTWWEGDTNEAAKKTWGLAHASLDLSRRKLEMLGLTKAGADGINDEPETLQDWIESVYRQIAPAAPAPYSPIGQPQEPGDAAPLTGRTSRIWALMSLVVAGLFLITLLVITLHKA